jgi:hypothetical protein
MPESAVLRPTAAIPTRSAIEMVTRMSAATGSLRRPGLPLAFKAAASARTLSRLLGDTRIHVSAFVWIRFLRL